MLLTRPEVRGTVWVPVQDLHTNAEMQENLNDPMHYSDESFASDSAL